MLPLIEPEILATLLNDDRVVILDSRFSLAEPGLGASMYQQGHIPGARFADLEKDLSGPVVAGKTGRHPLPNPDVFVQRLNDWGISKDSHVVVYDDGGHAMAARAWWLMRWIGVSQVQVLHGGVKAWQANRYPMTTSVPDILPSDFQGGGNEAMLVTAERIQQQLANPEFQLIDARAPERFSGQTEPLDAKAGHIPGAVCHPFTDNMDGDGQFLDRDTLKSKLHNLLNNSLEPVFYCGSGVTACHNILAMEYAGIAGAKLYPGSWSEWITDPDRPVETSL